MDEPQTAPPTRRAWAGWWGMIVQQAQNAFNDKIAQFILIPLAGAVGASVESLAGLFISLPFVLFAPIAGWLSDRYSKRTVIFVSAVLQVLLLMLVCAAVMRQHLALAMAGFFLLATQSALLSPAKMGVNKELLGSRYLGFATSIQQMSTMLAMLVGQILAGALFDARYRTAGAVPDAAWSAASAPLAVFTLLSIPALLLPWLMPRLTAHGAGAFPARMLASHFAGLRDLWSDTLLRRASFGVAFFWGFAAYINLWSVKVAKVLSDGGSGFGTLSSWFMAAASVGMAAGFGFSSWVLRRRVSLAWVAPAGLIMAVGSFALAFLPIAGRDAFLSFVTVDPSALARAALAAPDAAGFLLLLAMIAFAAAVFLAPLNAWMQDRYPATTRGRLQSSVNLQDCLAGILAVALVTGIESGAGLLDTPATDGLRITMIAAGLLSLAAALFVARAFPADLVRLLCISITRLLYRVRMVRPERIPADGGAMLLPNHVTYADAFFLATAVSRPLRFVMDESFNTIPAIRFASRVFETITIRRQQPIEAIRGVIDAMRHGTLICLFPEGQLTRTGGLCKLQRGFELISRKVGEPLVPVWCDGGWGSVFSYERGRFFGKSPRRETGTLYIAIGEEIDPRQATSARIRNGMRHAAADAITARFSQKQWTRRIPRRTDPRIARWFSNLDGESRRQCWANGHQIGMFDALPWHQPFHALKNDPVIDELPGLFGAFADLFSARPVLHDAFDGSRGGNWVGGDVLRQVLRHSDIRGTIHFHDFSAHADELFEQTNVLHLPGLAVGRRVISMSMADPPPPDDPVDPQHGRQPGSRGRLLPGWFIVDDADGRRWIGGPGTTDPGLPMPAGSTIDNEDFLFASTAPTDDPRSA